MDQIFTLLRASNKYIDDTMPWVLAKDESKKDRLETVLYHLLESIRVSALFLGAYLPDTSKKILEQIHQDNATLDYIEDNTYSLGEGVLLFQRINKDEFLSNLSNSV